MAFQEEKSVLLDSDFIPLTTLIPSEFSQLWGAAEVGCCIISDPLPVLHPFSRQWFVNIIFPQYVKGHFHLPWQKEEYFVGTIVSNFAPCLRFILKIIITPMEMQLWCFPLKLLIHLQSGSCSFATTWDPKCKYNWRSCGNKPIHFLLSCVRSQGVQRENHWQIHWNLKLGRK